MELSEAIKHFQVGDSELDAQVADWLLELQNYRELSENYIGEVYRNLGRLDNVVWD